MTRHPTNQRESTGETATRAALDALLEANPNAFVEAIGGDGRRVPMPDSVPLRGQHVFEGRAGLDLIVAEDQIAAIEAWARSLEEPVVCIDVHLIAEPDRAVPVYFFDMSAEYGVHLIVLDAEDPVPVLESAAAYAPTRHPIAHMMKDAVSVILEVDEATTALLGWDAEDLVGHRAVEFVHPDDVQRAIDSWMELRGETGSERVRVRYRHANGHYVWLEITNHNRLDDPTVGCVVSELVDISDEMAQLEALRDRERLLARLAEALPIGICHLRLDREVVYSNEPLVALLGPIDSVNTLIERFAEADQRPIEIALDRALTGRAGNLEVAVFRGVEERRCELTFRTLTSESGSVDGVIMCAADVTDRGRLRSELEHRASHDSLSGCLNRAATVAALERALREFEQIAVAYIDIDHFKGINDELGHAAGDEVLRVVAARIRSATRVGDVVGRIGGDEFVVICRPNDDAVDSARLVLRLVNAINGDVVFAKQRIAVRASVGAAVSLEGELDAEAVLVRADHAMYKAKRRNRARSSSLHTLRSASTS